MSSILLGLQTSGGAALLLSSAFLLLYPEFECDGMDPGSDGFREKCNPSYFCNHNEMKGTWHVVEGGERTLHNFMRNFDLTCSSNFLIGSTAMSLFLGFALGSMFLPALSYKYGMKMFFQAQSFLSCVLLCVMVNLK